jgi:hypothetical protein
MLTLAAGGSAIAASSAGNRARAQAEAARLLAIVQLPPDAVSSPAEPAGDRGALAQPTYDEATPNLVDARAWWTVRGKATAVLAYMRAHLPPDASFYGSSSQSETFSLPPVPGVMSERVLGVTVAALTPSLTGVRTDGEAVWIVPRPAWERIPDGVRRVTFSVRRGRADGRVHTLRGADARRLVDFINRLGVVQPGVSACPLSLDEYVRLQFVGADRAVLARAVEHPTGCASVRLAIGTRTGPPLADSPPVAGELQRLTRHDVIR